LDPVHPALVLQLRPHALGRVVDRFGFDGDRDVFVSAQVRFGRVEDLGAPALPFGEAQVHPGEVAGEQRRLLPSFACFDLEDDIAAVVGVAGNKHRAQVGRCFLGPLLHLREFLGEIRVFGREFGGVGRVRRGALPLLVGAHDPAELGVAAPEGAGLCLVGVHTRVGELLLDLDVFVKKRLGALELVVAHAKDRRISAFSRGVTLTESERNWDADLPPSCSSSHAAPSWEPRSSRSLRSTIRGASSSTSKIASRFRVYVRSGSTRASRSPCSRVTWALAVVSSSASTKSPASVPRTPVAMSVSEPPFSILRPAPKTCLTECTVEASSPCSSTREEGFVEVW